MQDKDEYPNYSNSRSVGKKRSRRTLNIALSGMLAGVYTVSTIILGVLSFGPVNLRLSNILIALVPILGWPSIFGIAVGVFLSNLVGSSIGPLDYFVSPVFSFVGLVAIYLLRRKSVIAGLAIYSAILSLWVTLELSVTTHQPFLDFLFPVSGGVTFVVLVLGYLTYRALIASGLRRRFDQIK
jgi:uncharacterized membrane protein